ncbi:MAG: hypothetical protein DRG20_06660 [Deltaproteobacteria bacterium]|nr:MAG: hypothetical protein DRG20_06660 [Deltaproteobacteria bacterium]
MKINLFKILFIFWLIFISFLGIFKIAYGCEYILKITNLKNGDTFYSIPVFKGESFSLQFLHSYDRAFYRDNFKIINNGKLLYKSSEFDSNLNGQGFFFNNFKIEKDGTWEVEINKIKESIIFIMGSKKDANHCLIINNKVIELSKRIPQGTFVRISLETH